MDEFKFTPKFPNFLHGADYNPDQWLHCPDILQKDIELMKQANCNCMSVGIFAWSTLEPKEGEFHFEWLDDIINTLYQNGIYTVLATPSGARPVWLAKKYPEVLRVQSNRQQNLYGERHNHCMTSPIYREKVGIINQKLAQRYGQHKGVIMWHISNEYGGACHCELCQDAFRTWLKEKYETIDDLNQKWWTTFWSHTFDSFDQIESPAKHGESTLHMLNLDWKRFVTDQTINFMNHEVTAIKKYNEDIPVTTNFMLYFKELNYFKFKHHIDLVSWDAYPLWHSQKDEEVAVEIAFWHDTMRSIKQKPFALMESTPSATNWQAVSKLKKPGMHQLSSLQAVAHGSNTVQYFQWRKSRGASEKFHGAVVGHDGTNKTRVFGDVSEVGQCLKQLKPLYDSMQNPKVALLFDWENWWAIEESQGPRNMGMNYIETVLAHYKPLWEAGICVDVVDMECDIDKYDLVIAPMLYMFRGDIETKMRSHVAQGKTLVMTYWSGVVDEHDLCYLGKTPGNLHDVLGISCEEIDALYEGEYNGLELLSNKSKHYRVKELCELIALEGAIPLAHYTSDFYAHRPNLTKHNYGKGVAYYLACRCEADFYTDFYKELIQDLGIEKSLVVDLPKGVVMTNRETADEEYLFIQNYTQEIQMLKISDVLSDVLTGEKYQTELIVPPYGIKIVTKETVNL